MENHPSREKLELFVQDNLSGDESVEVLIHLDECDKCCKLLSKENPQDVIERLLAEEEESLQENNSKIQGK